MTNNVANSTTLPTVRLNELTVLTECEGLLRENGLDSLEAMFNVSVGESLTKPGLSPWRERIRLSLNASGGPKEFYLKRFTSPPHGASREVRKSGSGASSVAGVEWAWLNRLADEGIACPRAIAVGEEMSGRRELRSALLIEAVPGRSLEQWASEWRDADRPTIRRIIGPTATLIARLHDGGYVHRDLYLSHLFLDPAATSERCLHLIDLARIIRPTWGRLRWIVKDLASLNFSVPGNLVSRTDRLRWLKRYLHVSKLDGHGRRLVYRIIGKTALIARHERRRQARFRSRSED